MKAVSPCNKIHMVVLNWSHAGKEVASRWSESRTESSTKREQTHPGRQNLVIIAGDSILKYLQSHKMSRNSRVKVSSFPGCTTQDTHRSGPKVAPIWSESRTKTLLLTALVHGVDSLL